MQIKVLLLASANEVLKLELSDIMIKFTKLKTNHMRTQTNKRVVENQLRTSTSRLNAYIRKEEKNEEQNESPKDQ